MLEEGEVIRLIIGTAVAVVLIASGAALQRLDSAPAGLYYELPLSGGDDYELCFSVPEHSCAEVERRLGELPCGCTAIGSIEAQPGIRCYLQDGTGYQPRETGYLHFAGGAHG